MAAIGAGMRGFSMAFRLSRPSFISRCTYFQPFTSYVYPRAEWFPVCPRSSGFRACGKGTGPPEKAWPVEHPG